MVDTVEARSRRAGQCKAGYLTQKDFTIASAFKEEGKELSGAETSEMWMLTAGLEHPSPTVKAELGGELVSNLEKWKGKSLEKFFWTLSRISARAPFHFPYL